MHSVVERAIGRLKGRFGCLHFLDVRSPTKVKKIIAACCALHNFALKKSDILEDEEVDEHEVNDDAVM